MSGLLVSELIALLEKQDGSAPVTIPWHEADSTVPVKSVVPSGSSVLISDGEPTRDVKDDR